MLLALSAGFVDTIGFVALFGLFTAHVTGNFVLIGASLVAPHKGIIAKLAALPTFALVVAATTLYAEARERAGKSALHGVLIGQIVLLAGFAAIGVAASPVTDTDAPLAVISGLLGVAAMAMQNAAARLLMSDLPATTVMTGSVTQFSIDATRLLRGTTAADAPVIRKRLSSFATTVGSFAVGALMGALLYSLMSFPALAVPMVALAAVVMLTGKQSPDRSS
jgi:uncharacterized membrane protein YoaK (UPF0700 family)